MDASSLISGYFLGLPDQSDWQEIYETLGPNFQGDSLAPMLARWMDESPDEALSWIERQDLPEGLTEEDDDSFGSSVEFQSLESLVVDQRSVVVGRAAGIWFRRQPGEALEWISQNIQNLEPEFFKSSLLEMVSGPGAPF